MSPDSAVRSHDDSFIVCNDDVGGRISGQSV